MIPELDRFDTGVISAGGNDEAALGKSIRVCGREAVVAPMEADEWQIAAQIVHSRTRDRCDVSFLTDKAAGEAADDEIAPVRRRLGMVRICDRRDVSRELHDRVLESGTSAQEWLP